MGGTLWFLFNQMVHQDFLEGIKQPRESTVDPGNEKKSPIWRRSRRTRNDLPMREEKKFSLYTDLQVYLVPKCHSHG